MWVRYILSLVFAALLLLLYPFAVLCFTIKFLYSRFKQIYYIQRRVIGIFSYSSPEDYHWITQGLESQMFKGSVKSTFSSIISNNNRSKFRQAVEKCDFAILYHTKNRGRINLTNVTDSLYDDEIEYMSLCKGRLNVIVVIDDLEKNDYEEKRRILDSQQDISKYARDLILVSNEDKMHQQGINNKLQLIVDLMSDESMHRIQYFDYLSSMTRWVCYTIMHGPQESSKEELNAPLLV